VPNHVSHKLTFAADKAEQIFAAVCPEGQFDFETLVPSPSNMYHGDLSSDDEKDFKVNWRNWQIENWGTKWNAYDGKCEVIDDKAVITFDTAWSNPYPVLAAFCNRFQIPFEHRYVDEGSNFWGIDLWDRPEWPKTGAKVCRIQKHWKRKEDYTPLFIELKGYDPDVEEEETASASAKGVDGG
jgi:hypothetical protein